MMLGLALAAALVVAERAVFVGLFDFAAEFRASGFLSSMHTGGASLDIHLLLTLPFAAACLLARRRVACTFAGLALFALGVFAVLLTFSRTDYAAVAVIVAVLLFAMLRGSGSAVRRVGAGLALGAIAAGVAAALYQAPYSQARFETVAEDADTRSVHWARVVGLREEGVGTALFGMGLGSLPRAWFWAAPGAGRPASFRYATEDGNAYLRLGHGTPLYLIQRIRLTEPGRYQLGLDLRSTDPGAGISVSVCEQTLLHSGRCVGQTWRVSAAEAASPRLSPGLPPAHGAPTAGSGGPELEHWSSGPTIGNGGAAGRGREGSGPDPGHLPGKAQDPTTEVIAGAGWTHRQTTLDLGSLVRSGRPLAISLHNGQPGTVVEVDNVSLRLPKGPDLAANGGFEAGADRWFFVSDDHLAWRAKNLWVQVLVEQGWIGVLGLAGLVLYALGRVLAGTWRADPLAPLLLASMAGVLVVGLADSVLDAPRAALLFYLLLLAGSVRAAPETRARKQGKRGHSALPAGQAGRGFPLPLSGPENRDILVFWNVRRGAAFHLLPRDLRNPRHASLSRDAECLRFPGACIRGAGWIRLPERGWKVSATRRRSGHS